jgi:hypothetical protein
MAAHRKLDRRRVYLCAVGLGKRAQDSPITSCRDHLPSGNQKRFWRDLLKGEAIASAIDCEAEQSGLWTHTATESGSLCMPMKN